MVSSPVPVCPPPTEWRIDDQPVDYTDAVSQMEAHVAAIRNTGAADRVWLLEHPSLYTAGTGTKPEDLQDAGGLPVYRSGRGGRITWHGPGQRIAYVMLDLRRRPRLDLSAYIRDLEEWIIQTLGHFNIRAGRRCGRVGVWVDLGNYGYPGRDAKIAAIGVRVRRWVAFHGVALNVDPDLSAYGGIIPCGIREHGITSMHELGQLVTMPEVDHALKHQWHQVFG